MAALSAHSSTSRRSEVKPNNMPTTIIFTMTTGSTEGRPCVLK